MSKCPYCDYETPLSEDPRITAQAEIIHMNKEHPGILRKRLAEVGIHPEDLKDYPYEESG